MLQNLFGFFPITYDNKNIIKTKEKIGLLVGCLLGIIIIAGVIWFLQWLFGLIPVILHRAYINYIIQIGFQTFIVWGIWKISKNTDTSK